MCGAPKPLGMLLGDILAGYRDSNNARCAQALTDIVTICEGLERDAERYRWLRDESHKEPFAPGPFYRSLYDEAGPVKLAEKLRWVWLRYGPQLDAAIDEARASVQSEASQP